MPSPKTHSTNSYDTFIAVAPDCAAERGTAPKESASPSVALRTFRTIQESPCRHTSDDVIFTVYADRNAIPQAKRAAARQAFFSKGQPCLRASDLGKKYGWGVHSDGEGRVALYGVETRDYRELAAGKRKGKDGKPVTVVHAMRSCR
ncbi:MAG TPA: DUF6157 family protein [Myxococcales bacterium]|jgi:hypothetical protein